MAINSRVGVNSTLSNWENVTGAVPQGSVLFIIFKNDLLKDMTALLFLLADETKLMQKPIFLTLKKKRN